METGEGWLIDQEESPFTKCLTEMRDWINDKITLM